LLPKLALLLSLLLLPAFAEDTGASVRGTATPDAAKPELLTKPEPIKIVLDGARRPGECVEEGKLVQKEVQTLVFPPGWTIAIMCTMVRWEQIVEQANPPLTHAGFTRMSQRLTVLNGAIFHDFPPNYRHIMAHELGHIKCGGCTDEGYVEKLAVQLEKGKPVEQVAFKDNSGR
jgi:hypothetical protein